MPAARRWPKEIREVLALDEAGKVFEIRRLRLGDGKPLVFETSFDPHRIRPERSGHELERNSRSKSQ